ncbi:hypothetical protein [Chitinophaga varians]|uniref:hypothetical protein n=1 Tax=Chitinophaga varians TaxID=2202339 RepID=UPI00165FFC8E|nr:hypothetical protein [Chitinophaga varians]MBC9914226.1 hypothetical protein [Chitinophaga varians]
MTTYFELTRGYCWKWGEDGQVIELDNGFTVCYTEALTGLLWKMIPPGWPPLGSILFILATCKESHTHAALTTWQLKEKVKEHYDAMEMAEPAIDIISELNYACHLLELVHSLPTELRAYHQQAHLLKTLFDGITPHANSQQAAEALEFFTPGDYSTSEAIFYTIHFDLEYLSQAGQKFPDRAALLAALQPDVIPPQPLPVELPLPGHNDLLTQLESIEQTAGISRLARHIMATIHVPMHTYNSGNHQLGGYSDLSNKGSYDRLLISELAQDDLLLTARLANNEALYLRREEPPLDRKKTVVILLDITLKMWGTPRAFGIAAALACHQQQQKGTTIIVMALGEHNTYSMNLDTPAGVVSSLTLLDNGLHMADALRSALEKKETDTEYYLITSGKTSAHPEIQILLNTHPPQVDFLLTVDREGALYCYHYSGGRKKLISHAQISLDEIMTGASRKAELPPRFPIHQEDQLPLRFPATNIKNKIGCFFKREVNGIPGIISINRSGRVEWRSDDKTGAVECCPYVEPGTYELLAFPDNSFSLLVNTSIFPTFILYHFTQQGNTFSCKRILTDAPIANYTVGLHKDDFCLYPSFKTVNAITGVVQTNMDNIPPEVEQIHQQRAIAHKSLFRQMSQHVSGLSAVLQLFISKEGELIIQNRRLHIHSIWANTAHLWLSERDNFKPGLEPVSKRPEIITHPGNPHVSHTRFTWADGSHITCDGRGLLFLRSSDTSIPDIVIAAALGAPAAAWANHHFTGNTYFQLHKEDTIVPVDTFFSQYILRFIAQLR